MRKPTPHSAMQDTSNLIFIAFIVVILAMAFSSCNTERYGCANYNGKGRHFIGYGPR